MPVERDAQERLEVIEQRIVRLVEQVEQDRRFTPIARRQHRPQQRSAGIGQRRHAVDAAVLSATSIGRCVEPLQVEQRVRARFGRPGDDAVDRAEIGLGRPAVAPVQGDVLREWQADDPGAPARDHLAHVIASEGRRLEKARRAFVRIGRRQGTGASLELVEAPVPDFVRRPWTRVLEAGTIDAAQDHPLAGTRRDDVRPRHGERRQISPDGQGRRARARAGSASTDRPSGTSFRPPEARRSSSRAPTVS